MASALVGLWLQSHSAGSCPPGPAQAVLALGLDDLLSATAYTCSAIGVACRKLYLLLLSASLWPTWVATRCRRRPMSSRSPPLPLQIVGSSIICIHQRPKLLGKLLPVPPRPSSGAPLFALLRRPPIAAVHSARTCPGQ